MNKKIILKVLIITMILAMMAGLAACSSDNPSNEKKHNDKKTQKEIIDIEKVAADIIGNITFKDQLSKVEDRIPMNLYGLDEKDVNKCIVYMSTGATAEELALFELKSEKAAELVEKQCENRIESQRMGYENYQPEELDKLSNPIIRKAGNYVILCVCDDVEKAQSIIETTFK